MRILVLFSLLLVVQAYWRQLNKLSREENIDLKSKCGAIYDPSKSKFPPWLYSIEFRYSVKGPKRFSGVVVSDRHIVVQANNLIDSYGYPCETPFIAANITNYILRIFDDNPNPFQIATSQCYHDETAECNFKAPMAVSSILIHIWKFQFAFKSWCRKVENKLEGVLMFEMDKNDHFKTNPICLPRQINREGGFLPNDSATFLHGQFPNKTANESVYHSHTEKVYPTHTRYKTASFVNKGGSIINVYNGQTYLVGFEPAHGYNRVAIPGETTKDSGYMIDNPSTDFLPTLCEFSGVCTDLTRITDEENKQLKSDCGQIFNPESSDPPPWLYSVVFWTGNNHTRVSGVVVSRKHILVPALQDRELCERLVRILTKWNRSYSIEFRNDAFDKLHRFFVDEGRIKVAKKHECFADEKAVNCEIRRPDAWKYIGECMRGDYFGGVILLEIAGTFDKPICLPKSGGDELTIPADQGTFLSGVFPNKSESSVYKSNKQMVTWDYEISGRVLATAKVQSLSLLINNFEGRTYFLGFASTYDSDKTDEDRVKMENAVLPHISEICGFSNICDVDGFKPESLLPTTTTVTPPPPPTFPPTQPAPEPTTVKPKRPRITRKPMLPFEYEDSDYMYYPEHTTKTKTMGTFWVTVFVVLGLRMFLFL